MNPSDKQRYYAPAAKDTPASEVDLAKAELTARLLDAGFPADDVLKADLQLAFPAGRPDWDAVKAQIAGLRGIRNTVLVAEMPRHPPMRTMSSVAEGIHPSREMFTNTTKRTPPEEL